MNPAQDDRAAEPDCSASGREQIREPVVLSGPSHVAHRAGTMLLWIAALHMLIGLSASVGFTPFPGAQTAPLLDIVKHGWVSAVEPYLDRMAAVWFLLFGVVLGLFAALVRWIEQQNVVIPRAFGLALAALCGLGVSLMPVSGFWLAFYPAWNLYRGRSPHAGRRRPGAATISFRPQ